MESTIQQSELFRAGTRRHDVPLACMYVTQIPPPSLHSPCLILQPFSTVPSKSKQSLDVSVASLCFAPQQSTAHVSDAVRSSSSPLSCRSEPPSILEAFAIKCSQVRHLIQNLTERFFPVRLLRRLQLGAASPVHRLEWKDTSYVWEALDSSSQVHGLLLHTAPP